MKMAEKLELLTNPDTIKEILGELTPFNLKRIYKTLAINEKELNKIKGEIYDTLHSGEALSSGNLIHKDYINKYLVQIVKIRISNKKANKGKSGGYRCILLIDYEFRKALMINIYDKSQKENLTKPEKNDLREFFTKYMSEKKESEKDGKN